MAVSTTNDPLLDAAHDLVVEDRTVPAGSQVIARTVSVSGGERAVLPFMLLIALAAFAAIVRIIATHNDFWLDEIISLQIANAVKTPWQIFTAVHSDNNHYLNTLYLYFVRAHGSAPVYRYLSLLWGVALVPAGYWLLARRSRVEAVILAGLLACSYPLIHFSSEARGYSGALFGSMLACAALTRWMAESGESRRSFFLGLTYGMAMVVAILSHLTACLVWLPLALGSLLVLLERPGRMKWTLRWVGVNLLPASVLAALYFFDLRFLTEFGGPPMTVLHGLARMLALAIGWPAKDAATVCIVLVPLIVLTIWQLTAERKAKEPLAILLGLIYLVPLACLLRLQPTFFSPRYFLVVVPFLYVPLAMLLARLVGRRTGQMALAGLLVLFLAGQTYLYTNFLRVGRGQFTAAIEYILAHDSSPRLSLSSSQDFRSSVELAYYAPRLVHDRQVVYMPRNSQGSGRTDWFILHEEGYEPPGPAALKQPGQPTWYRAAYFGASELSGQAWTVYSHQPPD